MRTLLLAAALSCVGAGAAQAQILITEVQSNPAGSGTDNGEWVEIQNVGTASVGLGGWTLSDWVGSSDPARESDTRWAFPSTATIAPGQVWVIAKQASGSGGFEQVFGVLPNWELNSSADDPMVPNLVPMGGSNVWALTNSASGDAMALRDPMGVFVDGVEWGSFDRSIPGTPATNPNDGESLFRIGQTGSSSADFLIATMPTPFMGLGVNAGPAIANVATRPRHVSFGDMLTVSATIADPDGIRLAELRVALATSTAGPAAGDYQSVDLVPTGTDSYSRTELAEAYAAGLGFPEPTDFHTRYLRMYVSAEDTRTATSSFPPRASELAGNDAYLQRNVMPRGAATIAEVRAQDAELRARWIGHSVRVRGTALTTRSNFTANRTQFMLRDATGAIQVFDFEPGTEFAIGDELEVVGELGQFFGATQIAGPGLRITPTGMTMAVQARVVTIGELLMDPEAYEGHLIQIRDADFVMPLTTWEVSCGGGGCNYDVTDGTGTLSVRIWEATNLARTGAPSWGFDISGVLSQRAAGGPNGTREGYQLWPRSIEDVVAKPMPPPPDAGVSDTGAPLPDGGVPPADAGLPPADAGQPGADAGVVARDSGSGGGTNPEPREDDGCGCATTPSREAPGGLAFAGLLMLGLVLRRRR
jgi:MYXO-CTERM domain-containing protein